MLIQRWISLDDLAAYPLITYDVGFTGRGHIDAAFRIKGMTPDIVPMAIDSYVNKQYVSLECGRGSWLEWHPNIPVKMGCKL